MATYFGGDFEDAVQAGVTPSKAEVALARSIVLELTDNQHGEGRPAMLSRWLSHHDVDPQDESTARLRATRVTDGGLNLFQPPDRSEPAFVHIRGEAAIAEAIAQLDSDGSIVRVHGDTYGQPTRHLVVDYPGGSQPVSYLLTSPAFQSDGWWRTLTPAGHVAEVITVNALLEGLEPLLSQRGMRSLREAHNCYRRRLWLAAASMLSLSSEAAWFNLARLLAEPGTPLQRLADAGDDAAKVQQRTVQRIRETKLAAAVVISDVDSQAIYFRDLRNYALHPGGGHDGDREDALTESGTTMMFMLARRYFVRLLEIYIAAETREDADGPPER